MRLLLLFAAALSLAAGERFSALVVSITDGDTLSVLWNGRPVRVRLHGIDAPERRQPFGTRARQFLGEIAYRKRVEVVVVDRDRFGRLVADVMLPEGGSLNQRMVGAGYAWWARSFAPKDKDLARLEEQARSQRIALWADNDPVPPWEWRARERPAPQHSDSQSVSPNRSRSSSRKPR